MGWQDAPIASVGHKPAWSTAPAADATPAPAGGAAPEDPREGAGFLDRVGARIKQRVSSLASGIDSVVADAADVVGLDGAAQWARNDRAGAQQHTREADEVLARSGGPTWESVKAHPLDVANTGRFLGEAALGSVPDIVLGVNPLTLPLYAAGVEGDTANRRAANNGRDDPGILDYLAAAPSAVANVALQKFGVGGKTLLGSVGREALAQGGIAGADYAGTTLGTDAPFSVGQLGDTMIEGAATGLPIGVGVRAVHALRSHYADKGVDTSGIPDGELVEGSLDGVIHPDVGPIETDAILRGAGTDPSHFTTPEKATAAAARIQAATARPNINDLGPVELRRQEGINENIAAGETDPAWATAPVVRTVPDDITIHAAPEGLIRSDDVGAQTGVDRHRGAAENVLDTAARHAENDPVLHEIINSDLEPNAKVGAIIKRMRAQLSELGEGQPEHPAFPDAPELGDITAPFRASTPEGAREVRVDQRRPAGVPGDVVDFFRKKGLSEGQARGIAAGIVAESRGDHGAVNPTSGAMGLGQWLGPRKAELIRRYGNNPSRQQQLEFLHWELTGGDHGGRKVLSQADPSAVMASYVRDFMRPAKGAETSGDLSRGLAALGAKDDGTIYRAPEPREDPFRSDSGFERTDAPEEPLVRDGPGDSRTATGDSSRPFRESTDDPADGPSWERRAQMKAEELHAEWEHSRTEPPPASEDPSSKYGRNGYGQRPAKAEGAEYWNMTDDGHIADVNGKPVAFRSSKEAAKFAAKEKLGGDFERHVWGPNSERVVLKRRAGSVYGERAARAEGPMEPVAGRSPDGSQRLLNGPDPRLSVNHARRIVREAGVEGARVTSTGELGPVIDGLQGRWSEAVKVLSSMRSGDALGVLSHPDVPGPIDVVWSGGDHGLGHIMQNHPEIVDNLPAKLAEMRAYHTSPNRIRLRSDDGGAVVRLDFDGKQKSWLLTAWEKSRRSSDTAASARDLLDQAGKSPGRPEDTNIVRPGGNAKSEQERASESSSRAADGYVSDPDGYGAGQERFDDVPPHTEADFHPTGGTYEIPRPEMSTGKEPRKPSNFARGVADYLKGLTRDRGVRSRISAEDAIQHGVPADEIFVSPRAKYPTVKVQWQSVFASTKAPLHTRGVPTETHSLDHLGDVMDFHNYEMHPTARPEPGEIADLLRRAMEGHESAWDRSDPDYETYNDWLARHDELDEFAHRYGDDWRGKTDQELDAMDQGLSLDDVLDGVLNVGDAEDFEHGRSDQAEASESGRSGEGETGRRLERGPEGEDGRATPPEDALFAERATDERDTLQRRADAGLKPGAEQKPAGSDGGLFDTQDTTGDLYGANNKLFTKEAKDKASATIRDAAGKANSGVDPKAFAALGVEAGFHVEASARVLASKILEPGADPSEIVRAAKALTKDPAKTTKGLLRALDRFGSAVAYSSDGALRTYARHYDAPTIAKLADLFQARAGAPDATGRTYDEALKRSNGRFRSRLDNTLDQFIGHKEAMGRIRDLLADPGRSVRATVKERAAAKEVRELLKDVHEYRTEAGEEIGAVKNYFPRVLDTIAVAANPGKFTKAAEKLYRELGVEDPAAAAESWLQRALDTNAGLDGGEEFVASSGKPSSSKAREFGPAADRLMREFLQTDPLLVLSDYITGSVRRAEQTRRFGPKGAVNSPERAAWLKEHGTKTQWDIMLEGIRKELHASGEDADGMIDRVKRIRDGSLGRLGSLGVRTSRAVSTIHAWNQVSTLQKVALSSIGDLAMGFVRSGPKGGVAHFTTSLKEAARLVETFGKKDPSDGHRWAEAMGTVGHGTASQLIQARMDAAPGAVKHAALLDKFYHKVGIEQLTQGGRIAATEGGKTFLDTLAGDLLSGSSRTRSRATLYMKELGIKDPQAFGEWVRNGGATPDALAKDKGHAADYATAVVRFADQTVLMPTRAHKPAWANHPVGSLVFALQSYNAAFTQNVLKRVGRLGVEGVKSKDPALLLPAAGLVMLVGMNAVQLALRQSIFGGQKPDDAEAFAWQSLERAGLSGMASPIVNAVLGLKYRRSISQSLQGSVIGRAGQAADAIGGLAIGNSAKTNSAERKAAGMVYDLVVDPTINLAGARYLRGAAGTAAIMGTGNKKGGALPGDRDAFIDAVAGEKKERVSSEK